MTAPSFLDVLEEISTETVQPGATEVDSNGTFPRAAIDALGERGLLGLTSASEVGGTGLGLSEAAQVVRRLAADCASTAMIVAMHYSAVAAIEAHGAEATRRAVAQGRHLSTLAFSESGSRSHFWAPLGTASVKDDQIVLNASKSWVTAASAADSFVWTSRPTAGVDGASLWLVPSDTDGLEIAGGFDGLGLRGNDSRPIRATDVTVPAEAALGDDGAGLDIALSVVLPVFQILNAACSLGLMDATIAKTIEHLTSARFEHLEESLADQPVARQHLAAMKNRADSATALVEDAVVALTTDRPDAPLRMLQSKSVAGDAAIAVCDTAMRLGGGAAFRKDVGIERHFRDARASAVMAPTVDALGDFIGRTLCGLPLFGPTR